MQRRSRICEIEKKVQIIVLCIEDQYIFEALNPLLVNFH